VPGRAALLPTLALAAALLAGCGSGGGGTATAPGPSAPVGATPHVCGGGVDSAKSAATGVACPAARKVMAGWRRSSACAAAAGASRAACTVGAYRCLSVRAGGGVAVSCARPGRSISFRAERR